MLRTSLLCFGWVTAALSVTTAALAAPPPRPLPGNAVISADPGRVTLQVGPAVPGGAAPSGRPEEMLERARRGVVAIERNGELLGLGSVLKNDGRVLTALSALGDGNSLTVRYADNSTANVRVGHSDRAWDLALLVPHAGRWPEGLLASEGDPLRSGAQLRSFAFGKGRVQPATLVFTGKRSLLGADGQIVRDVFHISTKLGPKDLGSPVVDETGNVVALLGRACVPVEKGPCVPTAFGVPVDALRAFLRTTPVSAVPPAPWLGIQAVAEKNPVPGVRVQMVAPESPAEEAGLKGGAATVSDLIVATDDQPATTPEGLSQFLKTKAVGERLKLLVLGSNGKFRELMLVLRAAPSQATTSVLR